MDSQNIERNIPTKGIKRIFASWDAKIDPSIT